MTEPRGTVIVTVLPDVMMGPAPEARWHSGPFCTDLVAILYTSIRSGAS